MKLSRLGLYLLLLPMLGACSARPLTRTETVLLAPPAALLADCPETPVPVSGNNGDLLELARMLRIDLAECNRSKARLREWAEAEGKSGNIHD
jgi:hypothetical protein